MSHLSLYGVFTPAILGVLHLIYSKLDAATPNTATIKHILAEEVWFSFRRLFMYAPEKKKQKQFSYLSPCKSEKLLKGYSFERRNDDYHPSELILSI